MCTAGINTSDFKLALHQQQKLLALVTQNITQWSNLAKQMGQADLADNLSSTAGQIPAIAESLDSATSILAKLSDGDITVTKL